MAIFNSYVSLPEGTKYELTNGYNSISLVFNTSSIGPQNE